MPGIGIHLLDENLTFGARVTGVTKAALQDAEVRAELSQLFEDCGVIHFDGVEATAEMQVEVSQVFGPLKEHPVASVERADGEKLLGVIAITTGPHSGIVEIGGEQLMTWQPWHFDHAYNNELNRAGVLRAITIAATGGRTGFADGIQIYRDMDPVIREKAEHIEMLYNLDLRYTEQRFGLPDEFRVIRHHDSDLHEITKNDPFSIHPALWTRSSGEKVFHMTPYGCRGTVADRSDAVYAELQVIWDEAMRVIKPYFHQWKATDMVIWDNWRVLHEATGCPPDEDRIVHRTTIKGDYGLGRWDEKRPQAA